MKTMWKIVKIVLITALVLAVLYVGLYFLFLFRGVTQDRSTDDLTEYERSLDAVYHAVDYMPSLDDCGSYTAAAVSFRQHESLFPHDGVMLLLRYDAAGFEEQRRSVEEKYRFYTEPNEYLRDTTASVNGYDIRMADMDIPKDWCVHQCLFIGINEDAKCIMYAYYYDSELDYIDDLDEIVSEYFFFPTETQTKYKRKYIP